MDRGINILKDLDDLFHQFAEAKSEKKQDEAQEKLMNSLAWIHCNLDTNALIQLSMGLELEFQECIEGMLKDEKGNFTFH